MFQRVEAERVVYSARFDSLKIGARWGEAGRDSEHRPEQMISEEF